MVLGCLRGPGVVFVPETGVACRTGRASLSGRLGGDRAVGHADLGAVRPVRVILAEDAVALRRGLRALLEQGGDIRVV